MINLSSKVRQKIYNAIKEDKPKMLNSYTSTTKVILKKGKVVYFFSYCRQGEKMESYHIESWNDCISSFVTKDLGNQIYKWLREDGFKKAEYKNSSIVLIEK